MAVDQRPEVHARSGPRGRSEPSWCPRCGENLRLTPPARLDAGVVVCDACLTELPDDGDHDRDRPAGRRTTDAHPSAAFLLRR